MLLDPSSAAPDHGSAPRAPRERRRSRKPALTHAEAARADTRTCTILEAYNIDFRPAYETVLVALSKGAQYPRRPGTGHSSQPSCGAGRQPCA